MIIDKRKTLLNSTKDCNNFKNCVLINYRKGRNFIDRSKLLPLLFPGDADNEDILKESDMGKFDKWLTSKSGEKQFHSLNIEDRKLVEILKCDPYELYFETIDDCDNFEKNFLLECFSKLEEELSNYIAKNGDLTQESIREFRKNIILSPDYFYFQVVDLAIKICRLVNIDLIKLEQKFKDETNILLDRSTDDVDLNDYAFKYLQLVELFLKEKIFPNYKVFKDMTFESAHLSDKEFKKQKKNKGKYIKTAINRNEKIRERLEELNIPEMEWDNIIVYLNCRDGSSAGLEKDDYNEEDIKKHKRLEQTGNFLYKFFARFYEYINPNNYLTGNFYKDLENIAVNNWCLLFESLIHQIRVHALEAEAEPNGACDLFHSDCKDIFEYYNSRNVSLEENGFYNGSKFDEAEKFTNRADTSFLNKKFDQLIQKLLTEYVQISNTRLYDRTSIQYNKVDLNELPTLDDVY